MDGASGVAARHDGFHSLRRLRVDLGGAKRRRENADAGPRQDLTACYGFSGAGGTIGRITTSGTVPDSPMPMDASGDITAEADGALWLAKCKSDKMGRIPR